MQITINIEDTQRNRVINALSKYYNYQDQIPDPNNTDVIVAYIDNPQPKGQFVREQLVQHIKNIVKQVELEEARKNVKVSEIDIT